MSDFEVNPPIICSICGELKESEELSDLDGQLACLDCIAHANVFKNIPLQELAAASYPKSAPQPPPRKRRLGLLLFTLLALALISAGFFYIRRLHHRQQILRTSVASLKTEGDNLLRSGKLDEALARYEAVLKQLQNKPLSDPQLVELYHQTEKTAAAPYQKIIMPQLERVEALLLAGRSDEARGEFRNLANFINAHTIQPEISVRERIDLVTDELRMPRIAKANWRKEIPTVAIAPPSIRPTTNPTVIRQPIPQSTAPPTAQQSSPTPSPQPRPTAIIPPAPPQGPQPISVPDQASQARALAQIRAGFADK